MCPLLVLSIFSDVNPQSPDPRLEIRQVIRRARHMGPAHDAAAIDGKGTARLPARAALGRAVPDALVLAQAEGGVQGARAEDVPAVGDAEAPVGVELARLVDEHLDAPDAADLRDPALRGVGRGVGDGDAVQLRVFGG